MPPNNNKKYKTEGKKYKKKRNKKERGIWVHTQKSSILDLTKHLSKLAQISNLVKNQTHTVMGNICALSSEVVDEAAEFIFHTDLFSC